MKNLLPNIVILLLVFLTQNVFAQVSYSARYENTGGENIIKVYLKSTTTYSSPNNQTATAQVTFKVPTGMIPNIVSKYTDANVNNLITLYSNGTWEPNARVDNPSSQAGYDFISFGLTSLGTTAIEYTANAEIPLFSFTFHGPCNGIMELIDNDNDAFVNNGVSSPENAISVLGAGGSAFSGLYSMDLPPCDPKEIAYIKVNFACEAPEKETYVYNDDVDNDIDEDGIPNVSDPDPLDPNKQFTQYKPSQNSFGTLAYEDLWPYIGDYDFNDFVVQIKESIVTDENSAIYQIIYDLEIVAMGGIYNNDFGIAIPDANNAATFTVYSEKDVKSAIDHDGSLAIVKINGPKNLLPVEVTDLVNAEDGGNYQNPIAIQIVVELDGSLQYPVHYTPKFFIERDGGNGIEIHLPGVSPTGKIVNGVLGSENDNSVNGTYYTNSSNLPWALYIPMAWEHPLEGVDLLDAYFKFDDYIQANPSMSWYLNTDQFRHANKTFRQ